jgi:hypothetical protein
MLAASVACNIWQLSSARSQALALQSVILLNSCVDDLRVAHEKRRPSQSPLSTARALLAAENLCLQMSGLATVTVPRAIRRGPMAYYDANRHLADYERCLGALPKEPNTFEAFASQQDCLRTSGLPSLRDLEELSGWSATPRGPANRPR